MTGLVVVLSGVAIGAIGWALLRTSGAGWPIGRLLSAAPQRSLEEAIAMAARGELAYIRLHGRIHSDEEFPSDDDKPLVYRRRRLQRRVTRSLGLTDWQTFDEERLAVAFSLSERGERVVIDVEGLGDGLVVVPRLSSGVAADLSPESLREPFPEMAAHVPVRLRIEQIAATDHGTASGVPRRTASGETVLGPGLGRPLILTTLAIDEAMRILGSDHRTRLLAAAGLLAVAPALVVVGLLVAFLGP